MQFQKIDEMEQFALKKAINLSKTSQNEMKNLYEKKHSLILTLKSFNKLKSVAHFEIKYAYVFYHLKHKFGNTQWMTAFIWTKRTFEK